MEKKKSPAVGKEPIKGNNRYTQAANPEEGFGQKGNQANEILLKIMQEEFPDDPWFSQGILGMESPMIPIPPKNAVAEFEKNIGVLSKRNTKNIVEAYIDKPSYVKYQIEKSYPTIDEEDLDDVLDEEWDYFEDQQDEFVIPEEEAQEMSGLFLVNQETDLSDIHDLYISDGPQTLTAEEGDVQGVFCVFYVDNGKARPVPNYKTLEVMLVEKSLTYSTIVEATPEQVKKFDLLLDGQIDAEGPYAGDEIDEDGDSDITSFEEFIFRSINDRSSEWNEYIRYRSGYKPSLPFVRDPGD